MCNIQCDQMVRLLIQNSAIYSNEHLPNIIKIGQSSFKFLPNTKETLQILPKIQMLANVAKFCQIWSHWQHHHQLPNIMLY